MRERQYIPMYVTAVVSTGESQSEQYFSGR